MQILENIKQTTISGAFKEIESIVQSAIDSNLSSNQIINDGFIPGMEVVGDKFRAQEIWVPEVLMAAKTMRTGVEFLSPYIIKDKTENQVAGKVMMGTVYGDSHDIGKNLVGMMLTGTGFEVVDIGENVRPEVFAEKARRLKPDIIGMSALLSTAIPRIAETMDALKNAGLDKPFKTIIGGAALSQQIADDAGVDAYADDAGEAVAKIKHLLAALTN